MAIKLRDVNPVVFNFKVGIGDSSPNEALVVVGTSRIEGKPVSSGGVNSVSPTLSLKSLHNTSNWAGFSWRDKDDNFSWSLTNDFENQNGTNELSLRAAHGTTDDGMGTRAFTILSDGKAGWGIRVPHSQFHIGGQSDTELRLSNSTIGDDAVNGTIIKSGGDTHFSINNLENVGSIYLQSQSVTGFEMDKDLNFSLGGSGATGGRVTITQSSLADDAVRRMLLLAGKFNTTALGNGEEGLSIGVKLTNSLNGSVTKDLITFRHNDSNIDTLINNEGGSVKIGSGVATTANGLLEIGSSTSAQDVKVRIFCYQR